MPQTAVMPTVLTPPAAPAFDVDGARKAGYSDDDILQHLTTSRKFDIQGALGSGYSKGDIINHLAGSAAATPSIYHPSFLESAWNTLKAMPSGILNTVMHPIDSSELGQFTNSTNSITPEEWAKANTNSKARAAGNRKVGMQGTPPTDMELPTVPEALGRMAGQGVGNAAMMGLTYGISDLPWGDLGDAAKVAAPDVGMGTAKVAGGAGLGYLTSKLPIPGAALTGMELGPGYVMMNGGKQILTGLRNGVEAFRGPEFGPETVPKGYKPPVNYPASYRPQTPVYDAANPRPAAAQPGVSTSPLPDLTPIPPTPEQLARVGGIHNQTSPSPVVRPPAPRFGTSPTVLPDLTPISGKLPGPRSVPSVEARVAAASTPEPTITVRPQIPTQATLDAAAKRIGFKSYADTPAGAARSMVENAAKIWEETTGPVPATKSAKVKMQPVQVPNADKILASAPVSTSLMPDLESTVIVPQAAGNAPIQPVGNNINYPANVHEQLHAAGPEVAITHGTNASAKDLAVAARLKNLNITPEAMDAMLDSELNKHYTDLGYKKLGSDYAPGKRVGRDAATGRAHLRNVLGGLWQSQ